MQISVRLPDELGDSLRVRAESERRTMGQVIRLALEVYLGAGKDVLVPKPAEGGSVKPKAVDPGHRQNTRVPEEKRSFTARTEVTRLDKGAH